MSIISLLTQAWTWLKKNYIDHIQSADKVAIVITETIKTLLANPVTGFFINVADTVTGTQIPTAIANDVNALIPKILAVELAIEGLPDNPTADDILAFEKRILDAFNVTNNNSKLYTELAAQIYGTIQTHIDSGTINFAGWVDAIETAYIDYQKDLAANAPAVSPTAAIAASPAVNEAEKVIRVPEPTVEIPVVTPETPPGNG